MTPAPTPHPSTHPPASPIQALELALDAPKRLALRAAVCRARGSSPLFDTRRWVSDFERMLLRMWAVHAGGRRPCHFDVEG